MTFRYYDPEYARFTQIDPTGLSSNFVFAANNPVMLSDPSGLAPCAPGAAAFEQWVENLDGSGEYTKKTNCGPTPVWPSLAPPPIDIGKRSIILTIVDSIIEMIGADRGLAAIPFVTAVSGKLRGAQYECQVVID